MSLAFIAAYFFKAPFWQRATVFITSIPITVLMNSFRIGVIGVLVENWGIEQAEGFLHSFEGWIIFMACMLILFGEMWLFSKFSSDKKSLSEAFGIDLPEETPENAEIKYRSISRPLIASVLIVLVGASMSAMIETREEIIPDRISFDSFPSSIEDWKGADDIIEKKYLDVLKLDDYILANYTRSNGDIVNFYSAYYRSQRGGASAHSPRSCIPGGGWQIKDFKTTQIDEVEFRGKPLSVNRLLIKKGDNGQLVYYWFQQRGRIITNEYLVKFYLFWDALTINRTDGALVRLTTTIQPGEDVAKADKRLTEFARLIKPALSQYIPE
jgi:exosortase D (VPLPA-CTERM-specific)